jgi:UDP-N-acetyl-D-glucosamine/UDP-N-acetyl-D-galactosamine dehydrogenase
VYNALLRKDKKIGVIGLGYVGLPIALEFAKYFSVIGFDINTERVEKMRNRIDPSQELEASAFDNKDIYFTADIEELKAANFFVIAVPTDIDEHKVPNLNPLLGASKTVGQVIKKGDYVIYESTVYPGCTEEDCIPIVEQISGLKLGTDFKAGYSPERINPGDKAHTVHKVTKVVSGNDNQALLNIAQIYEQVIKAGVYKAPSIRVAEAAKVIENTQRDINIAYINEISIILELMNIDTKEVLEAASTKWNFLNFSPGLVGGHCIGVDPYYLTHKAIELGYNPQFILSGRLINDKMPSHIAKRLVQQLIQQGKNPNDCKVLIMGITFKENVSDIRNSKVVNLIREINSFSIETDIIDDHTTVSEIKHHYHLDLHDKPDTGYDAVVVAVAHDQYKNLKADFFTSIMKNNPILVDLKGIYDKTEFSKSLNYWRL